VDYWCSLKRKRNWMDEDFFNGFLATSEAEMAAAKANLREMEKALEEQEAKAKNGWEALGHAITERKRSWTEMMVKVAKEQKKKADEAAARVQQSIKEVRARTAVLTEELVEADIAIAELGNDASELFDVVRKRYERKTDHLMFVIRKQEERQANLNTKILEGKMETDTLQADLRALETLEASVVAHATAVELKSAGGANPKKGRGSKNRIMDDTEMAMVRKRLEREMQKRDAEVAEAQATLQVVE
ncbi:unnamed protein product, partial [Chrysoparadoxa australica]